MPAFATPDPFALPPFVSNEEARLLMAVKLYELHRVTLGQAAAMIGYSKRGFMDVLGQMGVAVADYPAVELADEIAW
jgi:predicted HTH domain antitoxin